LNDEWGMRGHEKERIMMMVVKKNMGYWHIMGG